MHRALPVRSWGFRSVATNEFLQPRWDYPASDLSPITAGEVCARVPKAALARPHTLHHTAPLCTWGAAVVCCSAAARSSIGWLLHAAPRPLPSWPQTMLLQLGMYTDYAWVWKGIGFLFAVYVLMWGIVCGAFVITPVRRRSGWTGMAAAMHAKAGAGLGEPEERSSHGTSPTAACLQPLAAEPPQGCHCGRGRGRPGRRGQIDCRSRGGRGHA